MTTNLISWPFRVSESGSVVTNEEGSDECFSEELALLALTRPGERELVPTYGLTDPAFTSFPTSELEAKVSMYGPPIKIVKSTVARPSDGVEMISVSFVSLATIEDANTYDDLAAAEFDRQLEENMDLTDV